MSFKSQLRMTVVLAFGTLYIPFQKLLHLLVVFTSLTLSGVSILKQDWSEFFGVSAQTDNAISIWQSLYALTEVIILLLACISKTLSDVSTLSQEGV